MLVTGGTWQIKDGTGSIVAGWVGSRKQSSRLRLIYGMLAKKVGPHCIIIFPGNIKNYLDSVWIQY